MPNHVYNTITVSGEEPIVALFDTAVRRDEEQPLDFHRIIPRPAIVDIVCSGALSSKTKAQHPNRNWYEWNNENWDTKWNAYDFAEAVVGRYKFCSAWSPPVNVVATASRLFPELQIELAYQDECDCFSGTDVFQNGAVLGSY